MKDNNTPKRRRQNSPKRKLHVIRTDTGEVVDKLAILEQPNEFFPLHRQEFPRHLEEYESKLTRTEWRVFAWLRKLMLRGNRIHISQRVLAARMHLKQSQVSLAVSGLRKVGLLTGTNGNYLLNPRYALNGGRKYYLQAHNAWYESTKE